MIGHIFLKNGDLYLLCQCPTPISDLEKSETYIFELVQCSVSAIPQGRLHRCQEVEVGSCSLLHIGRIRGLVAKAPTMVGKAEHLGGGATREWGRTECFFSEK